MKRLLLIMCLASIIGIGHSQNYREILRNDFCYKAGVQTISPFYLGVGYYVGDHYSAEVYASTYSFRRGTRVGTQVKYALWDHDSKFNIRIGVDYSYGTYENLMNWYDSFEMPYHRFAPTVQFDAYFIYASFSPELPMMNTPDFHEINQSKNLFNISLGIKLDRISLK